MWSQSLNGAALSNLAYEHWLADQPASALAWARWAAYQQTWADGPIHPNALRTLGHVLVDHGRFQEAEAVYRQSDPGHQSPAALLGRALAFEGMGRRWRAAELAEARFQLDTLPKWALPAPHWQGWPDVETITIWDEQGFGDTIQESRWLAALLKQATSVTLAVRAPLVRLMREGLSGLGPQLKVVDRAKCAWIGCHGSLLSLRWRLQSSLSPADPGPAQGWLCLPEPAGSDLSGRRIGLIWAAGRYSESAYLQREAMKKSLPIAMLQVLLRALQAESCELVCLQIGPDRDDADDLNISWDRALPPDADFFELGQTMKTCDLIITVDTAAAHLAGALGIPAWVLLPWAAAARWGRDHQKTTLYRSLRLFRQHRPRDWSSVIAAVHAAVRQWSPAPQSDQLHP